MNDEHSAAEPAQVRKALDDMRCALGAVQSAAGACRNSAWVLRAERERLAAFGRHTMTLAGEAVRGIGGEVGRSVRAAQTLGAGIGRGVDGIAGARSELADELSRAAGAAADGISAGGEVVVAAARGLRSGIARHAESVSVEYERACALLGACAERLGAMGESAGAAAGSAELTGAGAESLAAIVGKEARSAARDYALELNSSACSFLQCGRAKDAVRLLEDACAVDDAPELRFNLAVACFCAGDAAACRRRLNRCAGASPDLVRALHALLELNDSRMNAAAVGGDAAQQDAAAHPTADLIASAVLLSGGAAAGAIRKASVAGQHGAATGQFAATVIARSGHDSTATA